MSNIKFKIAAKTDVGRVRTNNEDNLLAACDLTTAPMKWVNDEECTLGIKGALLVVADGMGGMNAGEVASEIAIETIREFFSPENITNEVLESDVCIEAFMKKAIVEADKRIKASAKANPQQKGMGTTAVIGWLLEDKLYVAWCGDSRAYIYNRKNGLRQITKDHSYVQELVDKGTISHDDAFDYPDSNIITRCLCDGGPKARPDTLSSPITVCNNDIILLCTDGLCGMIRDHEIETILIENESNISTCCDELINAACEASGQDNITVDLCKIISGCNEPTKALRRNKLSNTISITSNSSASSVFKKIIRIWLWLLLAAIVFICGYFTGIHKSGGSITDHMITDTVSANTEKTVIKDTVDIISEKKEKNTTFKERLEYVLKERGDSIVCTVTDTISFEQLAELASDKCDILQNGEYLLKNGKKTSKYELYESKVGDKLLLIKR